ncbi:MAG: hypothetical protein CL782_06955 [Chloroflexi bacterium]|nr:hypothetical protein [Chloroflexota bacterium]
MLDLIIAGAASGLLFGSFFITFTCLLIFFLYKDGNPVIKKMLESSTPTKFVMSIVIFSNPTFAALGIVFAYIFLLFEEMNSLGILFVPNIFYTIFVTILAIPILLLSVKVVRSKYWLILSCFFVYSILFGILIPLLII